jgi:excisionase family DNA binding protein
MTERLPLTLSLAEAAGLLGLHHSTLRKAAADGELRVARIGRIYRVSREELARYWRAKGGGELFAAATHRETRRGGRQAGGGAR